MAARADLVARVHELRHARTRLLPIDVAERVQHLVVRLETLLATSPLDSSAAHATDAEAIALLDECKTFIAKL